jgi:NADPH2:quinone reductase
MIRLTLVHDLQNSCIEDPAGTARRRLPFGCLRNRGHLISMLPKMMKAAVIDRAGPADSIHVKSVPVPKLTRGHVIVALDYAGVGIWDAEQRSGSWGAVRRGTILGIDGSGIVAAVASDVKRLRAGDRVYAYSYENLIGGFYAEYVSVPADRAERVPAQLEQRIAGAIPCVAITAQSGLRALKTKRGQDLLVFGASGGVGSLAVWLASNAIGATVTATARPDAHEYVRRLGAAHAIDPHSPAREAAIKRTVARGFDEAFITANGDDLSAFLAHLKAGAPLAFPNGVEPEPHADGHRALAFDGKTSRTAFKELNKAIGSRTIPLRVQVFSLERVVDAHRRIERGHVVGKIVLRIHR